MKFSVVYGNVSVSEQRTVKTCAHKYEIGDMDLVADLLKLVKSKGLQLFSMAACRRLIKKTERTKKVDIELPVLRRHKFLFTIANIPLFSRICDLIDSHSLEEAVDRLVCLLRAAYRKKAQSVCSSCQFGPQCDYGQFLMGQRTFSGTLHPSCPVFEQPKQTPPGGMLPGPGAMPVKAGAPQQMAQGAQFLTQLMNPANVGATAASNGFIALLCGVGYSHDVDYFDATFTGAKIMAEMESIVEQLTARELKVFELARNMDEEIEKTGKKNLKRSETPNAKLKPNRMRSLADVEKVQPQDMALPETLRNYRLATNQLTVVEHQKPEKRKQLYYMLIDSSSSMTDQVAPNRYAFVSKGDVASALALAVIKKTLEEKGMMFLRFFAGGVDILFTARTAEDLAHMSRKIAMCNYNGGSTDIQGALGVAFDDIQKGKREILRAETLLISDGEDSVDANILTAAKGKTKLHTLEIRRSRSHGGGSAGADLKSLSDTFIEVDPTKVDFEKVAKVVPTP